MKKHSKTAFTLIELIVSLLLVSVIVLGIFAIGNVLSNNGQDFGQRALVTSETQILLNQMLYNASLATGSGNLNDEGILTGPAICPGPVGAGKLDCTDPVNNPNSFCIHQNINGDVWLCYTYYGAGTATPFQIFSCTNPYVAGIADPRGATSCNANPNAQFVGSANLMTPVFTNIPGGQLLFTLTIQNLLNNTAAFDPANNPQAIITGSTSPAQESN